MSEMIPKAKCFFCERDGVLAIYKDMFPEVEVVIIGYIGKKPVCAKCSIDIHHAVCIVDEADDNLDGEVDECEL